MTGTLITSTPKASLSALAFQGIMVYASYPQIRDMLLRQFGDEYALLFARPVENRQNGIIDWYSPVQGIPRKLESLPDTDQRAIWPKISAMAREILAYAEDLLHSPDPFKITRGNILRLTLAYPGKNHIFLIGEQPVVVGWGFGPGTPGVEPQSIARLAPPWTPPVSDSPARRPQTEAMPPGQETRIAESSSRLKSIGWCWWLLPLLALCLLVLLLFTSFGSIPALSGKSLLHAPEPPFFKEKADRSKDIAELERQIAELESKLENHAAMCRPEPPETAPAPAESLTIPPQAKDTGFLEGKWLCDTGLGSASTREPVTVEFSFGPDGNGQGVTYEKNDQCSGKARAQMNNGELHIDLDEQQCQKSGHSYASVHIICTNAHGATTECSGKNRDGTIWRAAFKRIR